MKAYLAYGQPISLGCVIIVRCLLLFFFGGEAKIYMSRAKLGGVWLSSSLRHRVISTAMG